MGEMLVKAKLMESITGVSQPEENLHTKISHSASDRVFSHAGLGSCEHPHPMVPNTCVSYPQRCASENQLSAANSSGRGTLGGDLNPLSLLRRCRGGQVGGTSLVWLEELALQG